MQNQPTCGEKVQRTLPGEIDNMSFNLEALVHLNEILMNIKDKLHGVKPTGTCGDGSSEPVPGGFVDMIAYKNSLSRTQIEEAVSLATDIDSVL